MSRVEGGRCVEDAGAEVCGSKPVLTIGGWRSVEIAAVPLARVIAPAHVK
jgi:hypothetical protein